MIIKCVKCKKEINPMVELGIYGGCAMQGLDYICFKCFSEPPAQNKGKKMTYSRNQYTLMKFDPQGGGDSPYPSHAGQYREFHGHAAWLYNPWTGATRHPLDVGSDVLGNAIRVEGEPLYSAEIKTKII